MLRRPPVHMLHQIPGEFVDGDCLILIGVGLGVGEGPGEDMAEDRSSLRFRPERGLPGRAGRQHREPGIERPPRIIVLVQLPGDQVGHPVRCAPELERTLCAGHDVEDE